MLVRKTRPKTEPMNIRNVVGGGVEVRHHAIQWRRLLNQGKDMEVWREVSLQQTWTSERQTKRSKTGSSEVEWWRDQYDRVTGCAMTEPRRCSV